MKVEKRNSFKREHYCNEGYKCVVHRNEKVHKINLRKDKKSAPPLVREDILTTLTL